MPAETALSAPVKAFLERLGFTVKGEIRGCDVVAVREGEKPLVVVGELKLGLSLELVLQGVARLAVADEVYLAVPLTRRGRDQDGRARQLCRLLGLGLLVVTLSSGHVTLVCEPAPYKPRVHLRKRGLMLREFTRRRGDTMQGGTTRQKIMTAYRQQALACAVALVAGPLRPRDLRPQAPQALAILADNHYGWFERIARGVYGLTDTGRAAAEGWLAQAAADPLSSPGITGDLADAPRADRRDSA